ncbi:MAG: hypothetical protein ACM3IJ_04100 [Candidatus Levyibacteriota bacterium]
MNIETLLPEARDLVSSRIQRRLERQKAELKKWESASGETPETFIARAQRELLIGATAMEMEAVAAGLSFGIRGENRNVYGIFKGQKINLTQGVRDNQSIYGAEVNGSPTSPEEAQQLWYIIGLPTSTVYATAKFLSQNKPQTIK